MHGLLWGGIGAILGGAIAFLIFQSKIRTVREKAKAGVTAERASTYERLQQQERQIQELRAAVQDRDVHLETLQTTLRQEAAQRATAEAQLEQIPHLRQQLQDQEVQRRQLQQDHLEVRSHLSALQTRLQQEQALTQEKQALLDQAQQRLTDAFKALSADALAQNSQSFMQLAESVLSKFQGQAQGDLSQRQQAIAELVRPLQNSLHQVGTL